MKHALALLTLLTLAGCGDGSSEPADAARIRPGVEASTGWTFTSVPAYERIDRKGLLDYLETKLEGTPGRRVAALGKAFRLLKVLPADYDLLEGLKKAYTEEILAVYDIPKRTVFLVNEALDQPLTDAEKQARSAGQPILREITLAHEMTHALQHQHDPRLDLVESEDPDLDDVRVALHAFVEGEATLHGYAAFKIDASLYPRLADSLEQGARGKYADEPALIRRALYFPYIAGTRHVAGKVARGATGSAPRLHQEMPLSTEHLLHGRGLEKDPPVALFLPDLSASLGEAYTLSYRGVLGEAYLVPVLAGSDAPASSFPGSIRWGGDRLHFYEKKDGTSPVAVLVTIWDDFESTEALLKRMEGRGLHVVRKGRSLSVVAGLEKDKADEIGHAAIDRSVANPFRSVEELRKLRSEFEKKK